MRAVLISAVMLLTGCASIPAVQTVPVRIEVPVYVPIAPLWTKQVPQPSWHPPYTWSSLVSYTVALRHSLIVANGKLQYISRLQPARGATSPPRP